jgi:hypothetical protein
MLMNVGGVTGVMQELFVATPEGVTLVPVVPAIEGMDTVAVVGVYPEGMYID